MTEQNEETDLWPVLTLLPTWDHRRAYLSPTILWESNKPRKASFHVPTLQMSYSVGPGGLRAKTLWPGSGLQTPAHP
jgi:hypothetical protein